MLIKTLKNKNIYKYLHIITLLSNIITYIDDIIIYFIILF